jgi:excisionase family DNA binding protein
MVAVKTLDEVAQFLHVHPSTVYRLLKTHKIPAFKVGSDWRFNQDSIERWVKKLEGEQSEAKVAPAALSEQIESIATSER